jgi:hypothetical protein
MIERPGPEAQALRTEAFSRRSTLPNANVRESCPHYYPENHVGQHPDYFVTNVHQRLGGISLFRARCLCFRNFLLRATRLQRQCYRILC